MRTHDKVLPLGLYRSSIAWTGEVAYVFSGRDEAALSSSIIRFDPSTGEAALIDAELPAARVMAAAAFLPPYAYVFGGQDGNGTILDEIIRFDPSSESVERMDARLPDVRMGASAVTAGDSIYVIGGRNVTGHVDTVLRFTPGNGAVEAVAHLPAPGGGRVCVWDGHRILMFGGCGGNCASKAVYEYDPAAGSSRELDAALPAGAYLTTGVWTGEEALIFGGNDYNRSVDDVLMYTPDAAGDEGGDGDIEAVGHLPRPLELAVSFWDGTRAYVLGGASGLEPSDKIYVVEREDGGGDEGDDGDGGSPIPFTEAVLPFCAAAVAVLALAGRRRA